MRASRLWRDRFQAYRLWILERRAGAASQAVGAPPPAGIELRFLDRHARRDWVVQRGGEVDWPQFRAALLHEHDLVLAQRGGQTVGWAWIGYDRVHLAALGRDIPLPDGVAYLYDVYVRPAERGAGIGRALVAARCRRADERGVVRLLSHVMTRNEPSLRALRTHGFETFGRTLFVRALALKVWTRGPLPEPPAAEPAATHAG
jgi:ribosomal protein S18 acetylase RimI-like enzyme